MHFINIEEFYKKAKECKTLTKEEEIAYYTKMKEGDPLAKERLIESYLPYVASLIRRGYKENQTLDFAYYLLHFLEKEVRSYDFSSSTPFSRHLSLTLKNKVVEYMVHKNL